MGWLTKEQIEALVECDFDKGILVWKPRAMASKTWNTRYVGKQALNSLNMYGYMRGCLLGRHAFAHRVIWFLAHGEWPVEIDHINGVTTDNRLCNLRNVTRELNMKNTSLHKANKTGVPGLKLDKRTNRWVASIRINKRTKHVGVFDTFEEARVARVAAERQAGYHPNNGREKIA